MSDETAKAAMAVERAKNPKACSLRLNIADKNNQHFLLIPCCLNKDHKGPHRYQCKTDKVSYQVTWELVE